MIATISLLAANLLPLFGIAFWGWDGFELLVLYWFETAVIGFWTILSIRFQPTRADAFMNPQSRKLLGRAGRAVLFSLHISVFMVVHMVFLWSLFAGEWRDRIHGPVDFVNQLVIENGLWLPLAVLFVVRGGITAGALLGWSSDPPEKSVLHDLYSRIITMHITIIAGAWFVMMVDSRLGLFLVVALKTAIDLFFDPFRKKGAVSTGSQTP